MNTNNLRFKLQKEFENRCEKNRHYSLRSFARSLRIPVSSIQGILSGSRPLTPKTAERLAYTLGWIEDLKPQDQAPTPQEYQQLTLDMFSVISDWYHYAILELTKTKGFKPDPVWVAKRLKISASEVRIAVERMGRLGLLEVKPNSWTEKEEGADITNISGVASSEGSRKYQRQSLQKSLQAVEEVPVELRDHTSMVMGIDPEDLPEAREMIKEFRRRFTKKLESKKNPKEVYQIQISFFPLTEVKS